MSQKKKEPISPNGELPPVVRDALAPAVPVAAQPKTVQSKETQREAAPQQPESPLPASITIEVPLGPLDKGFLSRHVEARLTTETQRTAMRRLTNGLRQAGEKLADGKPVKTHADAVRWLLEQVVSSAL